MRRGGSPRRPSPRPCRRPPRAPFRPDLEGLRGLAVLPAVLYHAGVPGFGGGFVGVDVLFVLSGYFATRLLAREYGAAGTVDVAACRRARGGWDCGGRTRV